MSPEYPTVAEVAAALAALPPEVQDYEVWTESDPSEPALIPPTIDHYTKQVWL